MSDFVIFGNPVSHSKSPLMHNYFFKKFNLPYCYGRYELKDSQKIINKFNSLNVKGANVTIPHKEAAFKLADEVRGIAKKIGAVNTLVKEGDRVIGYNTDAPGFLEAIKDWEWEKALIIGAGGTAKALSFVLGDVSILNRSKERLKFFKNKKAFTWESIDSFNYDLIINTTSAGLNDDSLPAPNEILEKLFKNAKYAIDVIYGKETPFLKMAKEFNLKTKNGLDMLVYQGVLAMELFLGKKLNREEVAKIYFDILRG
ncbi:MAG: shikimate dehydrogenase [Nautiliaceae bacterium]